MSIDREDVLLAFRALKRGHLTAGDVRKAFKKQAALPVRKSLFDVLKSELHLPDDVVGPLRAATLFPDPRADRTLLDDLSKLLVEMEFLSAPEFEKIAAALVPAAAAKAYPPLAVPPNLGGYEVRWEMGRSEGCVVFRGHHPKHGSVSLKVFRPGLAPAGLKVRLTEPHPGLAFLLEVGEASGLTFAALQFVEGEPLSKLIATRKIAPRPAFELLEKAAQTLADLHAKGSVHGSLHASDLIVDKSAIRIKDFGGVEGSLDGDVRDFADILYEAAAGVPPYGPGESRATPPPAPIAVNKALEEDADRIARRAMAGGYASMAAIVDDLGRFARREPIVEAVAPKRGSKRGLIAAAAILLAAVAGWAVVSHFKKEPPPQPKSEEPAPEPDKEPPKKYEPKATPKPKTEVPPKKDPEPLIDSGTPMTLEEQIQFDAEGRKLIANREFEKLETKAEEVLRRGPKTYWAHYCAAYAQFERGEYDRALPHIDEALKLKPDDPDAIQKQFDCSLMRGDVRRTLRELEARFGKQHWGDVNQLIRKLGEETKHEPKEGLLPFERGALLFYKGPSEDAVKELSLAIDLGRRPALHFRAQVRARLDQFRPALDDARLFLAEFPNSAGAEEARTLQAELEKKVK